MFTEYLETPLGLLRLTANETALCKVALAEERGDCAPNAITRKAVLQLSEYFSKKREDFSVPLAPQGTPFQESVWAALAKIPYGKVVTMDSLPKPSARPMPSARLQAR